jgi:hypothetical protein
VHKLFTTFLIAVCAIPYWARGQNTPQNTAPDATCPAPAELKIASLYGTWVLEISSADGTQILLRGRVELEKNPEYAGSVSGWMYVQDRKIFVAGDLSNGEVNLEESDDGTRISAVWEGEVAEGSCGKAITGTRRAGEVMTSFVLRRSSGWN